MLENDEFGLTKEISSEQASAFFVTLSCARVRAQLAQYVSLQESHEQMSKYIPFEKSRKRVSHPDAK